MALDLTIEKLVYGGEGLARVDGEVVFTPFVLPGEEVEVAPPSSKKHARRADLLRVVRPSSDRVPARCPIFGACGGCHYQHADYPAQLRLKRGILAETLRRGAKLDFDESRIEVTAGDPWNYRNRTQFHIENGQIGFRRMRSQKLVPAPQCPISSPKINEALAKLHRMVKDRRWPRFVTSLEIFTDETQVQWNVREASQPVAKHFFDWLAAEVPGTVPGELEYETGGDVFSVSGNSFFQVNRSLAGSLADLAIGDETGGAAWDLYAGVGLFSIPLARKFTKVTAVEAGRAADDLRRNTERAGFAVQAIRQSSEAYLIEANDTPDFILADPPRAGLGPVAVTRLREIAPRKIVIVACDPATLARDLAGLKESYEIERLAMVDLFPQTFHIETIVTLTRRV
ncbi:MAG TPA: class I SAM-dependent RNA methyltransferase [Bryobacteraceae bacterium]|nr:class I SAM-dependent RNA methyltransferase [Bryobacteraceae bacterium]